MSYKIVRNYLNDNIKPRTIESGLTLAEVQAHCSNPQTSSKTCTTAEGIKETEEKGPWFDGYDTDDDGRRHAKRGSMTEALICAHGSQDDRRGGYTFPRS